MLRARWLLSFFAVVAAIATLAAGRAHAQGCTAARGCPTLPTTIPGSVNFALFDGFMQEPEQLDVAPETVDGQIRITDMYDSSSQGGSPFLAPGQLILSYQWNYADARHIYLRNDNLADADAAVALVSIQNEHVVGAEMGLWERMSFIYEQPFQVNNRALNVDPLSPDLTGRLVQKSGGIADARMYLRYWLGECDNQNFSILAGVKVPTGNQASGDFYQGRFLFDDISIQTGTGSWDPLLGGFFYSRSGYWTLFASANYRFSPSNTTTALALDPLLGNPASTVRNSITDQFTGDLGLSWAFGQWLAEERGCCNESLTGLSLNLALIESFVPKYDVIGSSDGFRRAFNALFLRPGFLWTPKPDVSLYANFPITVDRNLLVPGSFPDISYSIGGIYRW